MCAMPSGDELRPRGHIAANGRAALADSSWAKTSSGPSPTNQRMSRIAVTMRQLWQCVLLCALLLDAQMAQQQKYRLCMVEVANKTRKITKYCPLLNEASSKAECITGNSRLDCLRLLTRNEADFAVFEAEDIIVATNDRSGDLSVTNDIRIFEKQSFEYEMVAVVRKSSKITSLSHLQGKNLCHPGYGYETDWSDVMAKFFETRVVPQQCDASLMLEENYIKSSSEFFQAACKAGPWVPDSKLDAQLKAKYPNLCRLCDVPNQCSTLDKYWGRTGPLLCLTDGLGDVAWARVDDIKMHFGFVPGINAIASPDAYNFLCADGSLMPVTKQVEEHCLWLTRPWPAVIARRNSAEGVQKMLSSLKGAPLGASWQLALQHLLNSLQLYVLPLDTIMVPEDYLAKAQGFLSANSMAHCDSHRVLRICTRSSIENSKCNWLKEVALAYGVEPKLFCVRARSTEDCMKAVQGNIADAVTVEMHSQVNVPRKYGLKSLMFEFTTNADNMFNVAAVVKADSPIKSLEDLKRKKACFTVYDGVGWNTLIAALKNKSLLPSTCPYTVAVGEFFSEACVPGMNTSQTELHNLKSMCNGKQGEDEAGGEMAAFKCLATGKGDVAFIALSTITENTDGGNNESWAINLKSKDFRPLCIDNGIKRCYLSWAAPGQVLVKSSISAMRSKELTTAFQQLSVLFGKNYKTVIPTFLLFGPFNGQENVMFQDMSERFEDYESLLQVGRRPRNYEHLLSKMSKCSIGSAAVVKSAFLTTVSLLMSHMLV